ncbi:ArsR family transcriptional regulator [Verrucomicrobiota bacterium]
MLRELIRSPGQSVSEVARCIRVPPALVTDYLRALNARGLLAARRQGKYVYYRPSADESVLGAVLLLGALRKTFSTEKNPVELIFRQATAFTHPRRLDIIRALQNEPLDSKHLRAATGMSRAALRRHLRKLESRGFVMLDGRKYRCTTPRDALAKVLLRLAAQE